MALSRPNQIFQFHTINFFRVIVCNSISILLLIAFSNCVENSPLFFGCACTEDLLNLLKCKMFFHDIGEK